MLKAMDGTLVPSGYYQVALDTSEGGYYLHAMVGSHKFLVGLRFTNTNSNKNLAGKHVLLFIDLDVVDKLDDDAGVTHYIKRHPYRIQINYEHCNQLLAAVGSNMTVSENSNELPDNFGIVNELENYGNKPFTLIVSYKPSRDVATFPIENYRFASNDVAKGTVNDRLINLPTPKNSILINRSFSAFTNEKFMRRLLHLGINQFVIGVDSMANDNCFKSLAETAIEQNAHAVTGLQSELSAVVIATRLVIEKRRIEADAASYLLVDLHQEFPLVADEWFSSDNQKEALRSKLRKMRDGSNKPLNIDGVISIVGKGKMAVADIPQGDLIVALNDHNMPNWQSEPIERGDKCNADWELLKTAAVNERKPANSNNNAFAEFAGNKVGTEFSGAIKNTVD